MDKSSKLHLPKPPVLGCLKQNKKPTVNYGCKCLLSQLLDAFW